MDGGKREGYCSVFVSLLSGLECVCCLRKSWFAGWGDGGGTDSV